MTTQRVQKFSIRDIESLIAHQIEGIVFAAPEVNGNISTTQSQLPAACPIVFLKSRTNPNIRPLTTTAAHALRSSICLARQVIRLA